MYFHTEKCRTVQDIERQLQNSPRSGCSEITPKVSADGHSRYRARCDCTEVRSVRRAKKSGTAEVIINTFVSLKQEMKVFCF